MTLTHLGSIAVTKGASVVEGDGVGTIGPSGEPGVSGPYVHLGVRETADPRVTSIRARCCRRASSHPPRSSAEAAPAMQSATRRGACRRGGRVDTPPARSRRGLRTLRRCPRVSAVNVEVVSPSTAPTEAQAEPGRRPLPPSTEEPAPPADDPRGSGLPSIGCGVADRDYGFRRGRNHDRDGDSGCRFGRGSCSTRGCDSGGGGHSDGLRDHDGRRTTGSREPFPTGAAGRDGPATATDQSTAVATARSRPLRSFPQLRVSDRPSRRVRDRGRRRSSSPRGYSRS